MLFKPENSLINQSLRARKSVATTNGDGFGVGWYGRKAEPGLYRDLRPAWNDENLRSLSEQIESSLFFAHVRASTGTATSRANCHPFRQGRWLFMHNGQIGGFDRIARELDFQIAPTLYRQRQGTTDSETIFFLLLTNGLDDDPETAVGRTVARIEVAMAAADSKEPLRLTAAFTDGRHVYAIRYSSDHASPTLFYGCAGGVRGHDGRCTDEASGESILILSEPLDTAQERWTAVEEGHLLIAEGNEVRLRRFAPAM